MHQNIAPLQILTASTTSPVCSEEPILTNMLV